MANKESTAVNALIDLVQAKPLGSGPAPGDDLFGAPRPSQPPAPLPRLRAPGATSQLQLNDVPASKVRMMNAPTNSGALPSIRQSIKQPSQALPPVPATRPSGTPAPTLTTKAAIPPPRPRASVPPPRPSQPIAQPPPMPAPPPPVPAVARPNAKPVVRVTAEPIVPKPVPQPRLDGVPSFTSPRAMALDMTGDVVTAESWFESSRAVEKFEEETFVGTAPVVRLERKRKLALFKIVATSVVFVVIGVVIGAYIAFRGEPEANAARGTSGAKTAATAKPAATTIVQPMPAQAAPAVEAPPAPKLADVRIDSTPSGATVMLIDNGKQSLLGNTPISTSLDMARSYDVVFTLDGRPSKTMHFDPSASQHLEVALDKAPAPVAAPPPAIAAAAPTPAVKPAPVHHVAAHVGQIADPGFESAPPSSGGNGTLMVSTKPPCEIEVDGKDTGMRTPQRALALSAGMHKITFVNAAEHINKTVTVSVTADHTTKLIKDLLAN